jgi:TatD DNase family protein
VIEKVPLERIIVETDSPYLSPEPFRGQINYPKNIVHTIQKLAEIKKVKLEIITERTHANAKKILFSQ